MNLQTSEDPRPVHVKLIQVNGVTRFCTVLPPGPIDKAEEMLAETTHPTNPKRVVNQFYAKHYYEGLSLLQDYLQTKLDKQ